MSYRCGAADWLDLAIGRLEDAKRSLRNGTAPAACDEMRQARRCLNRGLLLAAEKKEIVKDWSTR